MINELLSTQLQQLRLLLSLLQNEKSLLEVRDIDGLIAIAQQKQQQLDIINQTDKAIEEHPNAGQLTTDAELTQLRQTVESTLLECQEQNSINGKIIEATSKQVTRLAETLDQMAKRQSMTYDRLGMRHGAQRLGKSYKA